MFWSAVYDFFILMSLALTPPALVASACVAYKWHANHKAYMGAKNPTPAQTINAGIYRGFVGSFVDNLWWGFAWTFHYLGMEGPRNFFFTYGVISNVFFRQIATTWAASLHIRAEAMSQTEIRREARAKLYNIVALTGIATVFYVALLFGSK